MAGGDAAGGSRELARLIDKAGEELLFDFRHYLGLDFLDVFKDGSGLTPRLALSYVRQLPMDSATQAALQGGPEYRGWDVETYQSADQVDLLNWLIYVLIAVNSDKNKKPKKPEPTYRPGEKKRKQAKPNSFAMQAMRAMKQGKQGSNGGTRSG